MSVPDLSACSAVKIDDDLFEELEEQLLIADVGVETTRKNYHQSDGRRIPQAAS
ncbi:signal recognition particle receptor subunit alpha [Escherichia coli]